MRPTHPDLQIATPDGDPDVQSVDWVSGACLMIRRAAYEAIGPLDESFWLYTEETDWCYRARQAGGSAAGSRCPGLPPGAGSFAPTFYLHDAALLPVEGAVCS